MTRSVIAQEEKKLTLASRMPTKALLHICGCTEFDINEFSVNK
jgi:hypothetical protein